MFASWSSTMRGPRVKTPLLLLLLLLLLSGLTGTVFCEENEDGAGSSTEPKEGNADDNVDEAPTEPSNPLTTIPPTQSSTDGDTSGDGGSGTDSAALTPDEVRQNTTPANIPGKGENSLGPIIILIPVALVVVIIGLIVCFIFINRRWNKKAKDQELRKEDPYLDGSSTDKVPMPMFEEDVPSVLELEMEEFDKLMKKNGETGEDSKHV